MNEWQRKPKEVELTKYSQGQTLVYDLMEGNFKPNKSPSSQEEVDSWGCCHLKKLEVLCWTQESNSQETVSLQFKG